MSGNRAIERVYYAKMPTSRWNNIFWWFKNDFEFFRAIFRFHFEQFHFVCFAPLRLDGSIQWHTMDLGFAYDVFFSLSLPCSDVMPSIYLVESLSVLYATVRLDHITIPMRYRKMNLFAALLNGKKSINIHPRNRGETRRFSSIFIAIEILSTYSQRIWANFWFIPISIHWMATARVSPFPHRFHSSLMNLNCRGIRRRITTFPFPIVAANRSIVWNARCACLMSSTRFIHSKGRNVKDEKNIERNYTIPSVKHLSLDVFVFHSQPKNWIPGTIWHWRSERPLNVRA